LSARNFFELNNIFNSANYHDLNFLIIRTELLNIQKQYENVAIYLCLVINFAS
jgi:hypothetical protein